MRTLLRTVGLLLAAVMISAAAGDGRVAPVYAPVKAGAPIAFPRDHGAHPDFRTEW